MTEPFKALTGLRGICAIQIVCGHFFTSFAPASRSYPSVPLDYLAPVTLFFIVSGFLLGVIYKDKLEDWPQRKTFWIKRFARLAPMYWFSLLVALPPFIAYSYSKANLWSFMCSLILTPLFLQSVTLVGNDWSGPLWQISAFALCYAIYPFTLHTLRSKTKATVCFAVFFIVPMILLGLAFKLEWPLGVIHDWAVIRAPQFFIGVILGLHYSKETKKTINDQEYEQIPERIYVVLVELVTLVLLTLFVICWVFGALDGPNFWWTFMLWEEFAVVPFHCLWIYLLCRSPHRGVTIPFFSSWIMQKLGEISYSVYVMHWPLLNFYSWLKVWNIPEMQTRDRGVHMGFDTSVDGLFVLHNYDLLGALSFVICVAAITNVYIENPARDWITKRFASDKGK